MIWNRTARSDMAVRLARAWQRERLFVGARGLCHLLTWAVSLLVLDLALDWVLNLPGAWRLALLAMNATVLLVVFYWTWLRRLREYDAVRVALQVETMYPQLQSLLVSYVQLQEGTERPVGASPALLRAMRRQALERTRALDFREIVRFSALSGIALLCIAVLTVASVLAANEPGFVRGFPVADDAARDGNPLPDTDLHYLGYAQYDHTGRARPPTLRAKAAGELPGTGILVIRPVNGNEEMLRISAVTDGGRNTGEFVYRVNEVFRDFTYSFRLGDAVSDEFLVAVVPPPRTRIAVELTYPEYTKWDPRKLETLSFEMLEGSRVEWRLTVDRALAAGELVPEKGEPVPVALSDDGPARCRLPCLQTSRSPTGSGGGTVTTTLSMRRKCSTRSASCPTESQPFPLLHRSRTPRRRYTRPLRSGSRAGDDYGLKAVRLVYALESTDSGTADDKEKTEQVAALDAMPLEVNEAYKWRIRRSLPLLKAGDVVRYSIGSGRQPVGRSGPGHCQVRGTPYNDSLAGGVRSTGTGTQAKVVVEDQGTARGRK